MLSSSSKAEDHRPRSDGDEAICPRIGVHCLVRQDSGTDCLDSAIPKPEKETGITGNHVWPTP